jgi:hypothetical protein
VASLTEDEEVVETVSAYRAHKPLNIGMRVLGGMKRETLRSPMSMPSLSNSP